MSRFMQREKVKRVITGLTFDLKTKERKPFTFVPSIPNKPKDVLGYARKKLETSPTTRVLKASYEETSDLYITLTKLFMLKARALKTGESKNGFVTYTVNYKAITVTALNMETDEIKEETIYTQKKLKDLLAYARTQCEKPDENGEIIVSVIDAEYNEKKDLQGVYVLPVEDFYKIAKPAKDGKLSDDDVIALEMLYKSTLESMASDTESVKSTLETLDAIDDIDDNTINSEENNA